MREAYHINSMAAHGAAGQPLAYVDQERSGERVYEYYKDPTGRYWYKSWTVGQEDQQKQWDKKARSKGRVETAYGK